ncbi:putative methyltransferase-domain-containing protein [Pelagophyceae sp. CCMP2097]|nr:putative methyltransferase-domain-containing protein [Pelagophyceae sp. CCMP2097]
MHWAVRALRWSLLWSSACGWSPQDAAAAPAAATRRSHLVSAGLGAAACLQAAASNARCSEDQCIFEKRRTFVRAGRTFVIEQEFNTKQSRSTGTGVWECAEVLSSYLADTAPSLAAGQRVLELGAGCGLCSIVAAAAGAQRVVTTDGDEGVLRHLEVILDANTLQPRPETVKLRWEDATAATAASLGAPFDVILGADVTYYPGSALSLANALVAHASPRTTVLLAHKRRRAEDDQTLATLGEYFEFSTLVSPKTLQGVTVFALRKRASAPDDLGLGDLGADNCNPGYARKGNTCILAA